MKYLSKVTIALLFLLNSLHTVFAFDESKTAELNECLIEVVAKLFDDEVSDKQVDVSFCNRLVLQKADPNVCVYYNPNVNFYSPKHLSPLHVAAMSGDVELIRFLVQHGADVEDHGYGWEPLNAAAAFGHEEAITELFRLGAKIDQDCVVHPLLLEATQNGHINAIIRLVNAGASPYQTGAYSGLSAFGSAKGEAKRFFDTYCINFLASQKENALIVALTLDHKEVIHCVFSTYLSNGTLVAIINQADTEGRTPFDIAMIRKNENAMLILLMYGADLFSCRLNVLRFASQIPEWKTIKTMDLETLPIVDKNMQLELEKPLAFYDRIYKRKLECYFNILKSLNYFNVLPEDIVKEIIEIVLSDELVSSIVRK